MSHRIHTIINGEYRKVSPDFFHRANEFRAGRNKPLLRELDDNEIAVLLTECQGIHDMETEDGLESTWLSPRTVSLIFCTGIILLILALVGLLFGLGWFWYFLSTPRSTSWMDWMSDHRANMIVIETGIALLWGMLT